MRGHAREPGLAGEHGSGQAIAWSGEGKGRSGRNGLIVSGNMMLLPSAGTGWGVTTQRNVCLLQSSNPSFPDLWSSEPPETLSEPLAMAPPISGAFYRFAANNAACLAPCDDVRQGLK